MVAGNSPVCLSRFGEATLLPALPQDSPFTNITLTGNGTLETSVRYGTLEPGPEIVAELELELEIDASKSGVNQKQKKQRGL